MMNDETIDDDLDQGPDHEAEVDYGDDHDGPGDDYDEPDDDSEPGDDHYEPGPGDDDNEPGDAGPPDSGPGEDGENPCYPDGETNEAPEPEPFGTPPTVEYLTEIGDKVGPPTGEEMSTADGCRRKVLAIAVALNLVWVLYLLRNGYFALTVMPLIALYEKEWGQHFFAEGGNLYRYEPERKRYEEVSELFSRELVEHGEALAEECRQARVATGNWPLKDAATVLKALPKAPGGEETAAKCRTPLARLWTRPGERMNGDRTKVNLRNGLLDLGTLELRPHTPDHLGTIQLPFDYVPGAKCPRFLAFLEAALPDPATRAVLQEFTGYLLIASTEHERALFLTGEGANGKSTFVGLLPQLLGKENCSAVPIEELGLPFRSGALRDKSLNLVTEVDTSKPINDAKFKACVSGDMITGERKFENPSMFAPFARFVAACNELPRVKVDGPAFYRRLIVIRFDQKFVPVPNPDADPPELQADPGLKNKLKKELPGIFAWALEGLARLNARGRFDIPPSLEANVEEYRREENNALRFLHEACEFGPDHEVSAGDLYRAYEAWCATNREKPYANSQFGRVVVGHPRVRFWKTRGKGRHYKGVCTASGDTGAGAGPGAGGVPASGGDPTPFNARRSKHRA